jgi:hypothetical protein
MKFLMDCLQAVLSFFSEILFGCSHSRVTRPFTLGEETYEVCHDRGLTGRGLTGRGLTGRGLTGRGVRRRCVKFSFLLAAFLLRERFGAPFSLLFDFSGTAALGAREIR